MGTTQFEPIIHCWFLCEIRHTWYHLSVTIGKAGVVWEKWFHLLSLVSKKTLNSFKVAAAAAAAKSLQSCQTLCDSTAGNPPGSPVPGILQARTLEWVAISFSNAWKWKVKVKSLSCVRLLATPWTAAYQAPPSMGFSRQEYWSGVPLPSLSFRVRQGKKCPLSLKIYFLGWQSECSFFSKNFFLLLLRAQSLLHSCQKKSVYWLSTCECEMKILSFKEHVYGGVCCKMLRSMELSNIIVYS